MRQKYVSEKSFKFRVPATKLMFQLNLTSKNMLEKGWDFRMNLSYLLQKVRAKIKKHNSLILVASSL